MPAAYIKAKHDAAPDTVATLVDGQPTALLDHVLVAEMLWQRERARHGELVQGINLWTDAGQVKRRPVPSGTYAYEPGGP